jgi:hypothetical protein
MSLLDEAVKLQIHVGVPCAVGNLRKSDPALYAELLEGLASTVQASALGRALLKEHGVHISGDRLTAHRRGECAQCHF